MAPDWTHIWDRNFFFQPSEGFEIKEHAIEMQDQTIGMMQLRKKILEWE
jgi:hypothetical protein